MLGRANTGCGGSGNKCRIDRLTTVVDGDRQRFTWGGGWGINGHLGHLKFKNMSNADYTDWLYERLQRRGYLKRDVQRMINQDRNYFGAAMCAHRARAEGHRCAARDAVHAQTLLLPPSADRHC